MKRYRRHLILIVIAAVVVLTVLFSHGIRVRFIWGGGGFVAGLICGVLLTVEVRHRRHRATKS
ncbi:MAG TPA: hypothetical protein VFV02_07465 [Acidimicrobiales bacterium]|nr:hypothetical protein [Acidimicrobiales bacterium]